MMNVLNIEHLSKIFGGKVIFDDISYGVHDGDKIGIIGINGTGKSTLLKIIAGHEEPDEGQIIKQNGLKISYLPQEQVFPEDTSILSYVSSGHKQEEWDADNEARSILNSLGITDHNASIKFLSGGQKKRAALAKVFLSDSDLILLDEPTNHLDAQTVNWLEDYLKKYRGIIIMVTHDRYFLDKVTNKILEISHGQLYSYEANYSGFLELKAQREEMEQATQRKLKSVLRMEMDWAKRGCRARSTKQKARLERLEALKMGVALAEDEIVELDSVETRLGKKTIELQHITKGYDGKKLIRDFSYIFLKNQRVGIIGSNGCGKSTLVKMIAGIIKPDEGSIEIGETVKIGYFAQEEQEMDDHLRVIDYVKNIAEYIATRDGKISASQMLERFLFTPDMQYAPIGKLSGGEKRRLYLLGILSSGINVFLLDEAGNSLDIPTLTILEDFLNSFSGIVVTVSHDRYFLDNVVDRIFAFEDGCLVQYEGGYTDYVEARQKSKEPENSAKESLESSQGKAPSHKTWKQNQPVKLKFSYKEQREYDIIDERIAALEEKITALDADIMANATNSAKLNELTKEKEQAAAELEEQMERWVYLNDLAEKIEAQKKK